MMMDDKDRNRLRKAINRAADHARPVRGKDEVALRTSDWHAILKFVEVGQPLGFVLAQTANSTEPTP